MTAKEIYEAETGIKANYNQFTYDEWRQDYVKWLESKVEKTYEVLVKLIIKK